MNRKLTILAVVVVMAAPTFLGAGKALAVHCDATVGAPGSIQIAIDSNPGGVVCLDDSTGAFTQQVVFGFEDSGTTLTANHDASPVLDGTLALASAITLQNGVTGVTIEGLEIQNYTDAGIVADGPTSKMVIRNNHLTENGGEGLLVSSDGSFMHERWKVEGNDVGGNAFGGLVLTNCNECKVKGNFVHDNEDFGILVEAFNTTVIGVQVVKNDVSGTIDSGAIDLFASGAPARITKSKVKDNNVHHNRFGIILVGFGSSTVDHNRVENNIVVLNELDGIDLQNADMNTLKKNSVFGNGADGFLVRANSSGNTFERNKSNANGVFGFRDFSAGGGTAGTANTYKGGKDVNECRFNIFATSDPLGLCTPQP